METDHDRLERVAKGDYRAFEKLTEDYRLAVNKLIRTRGVTANSSDDIWQEVWQSVWRILKARKYDRDKGRFLSFLLTITRNKIADYFRRNARRARPQGGTAGVSHLNQVPQDLGNSEEFEEIAILKDLTSQAEFKRQLRERMTERQYSVFERRHYENMSNSEIAEELAIPPSRVSEAWAIAVKKFIEFVQGVIQK